MGLLARRTKARRRASPSGSPAEAPATAPPPVVAPPAARATATHARPKLHVAIKTFVIGLAATDKLAPSATLAARRGSARRSRRARASRAWATPTAACTCSRSASWARRT